MSRLIRYTFLLLAAAWFSLGLEAQPALKVNYFKPFRYDISSMTVKAWIDGAEMGALPLVKLDGRDIPVTPADSGRFELTLPLAGKPGLLVLRSAAGPEGKVLSEQVFRPLVPSDWGYFGTGTVNIICSSHQDIAWMNTPDSCREERIRQIIIPALDMIDSNPSFRFEMEQTLNLMEVLEAVPAERDRIINAYKKGQFSWGATYNQPYEGLESGEQLVRQAYLGRKWIKDNIPGMDAEVAYNVDVPGRTLQSPQIFSKAGIKYLFVSRMKEGFSYWYSPDGSRILTYSPGNYGWSLLVYRYFEDDALTAIQKLYPVLQGWNEYYKEHKLPPQFGVIISTDAGGPKDYSAIINEWNAIAKASGTGMPVLMHATAEEFLGRIDVPGIKPDSIMGERPDLWLYIHGPAHYEAISAKKSAAVSLPAAEIFSSIDAMVKGLFKSYPAAELRKGWLKSVYPDHGWGGKHGEITDSLFRVSLEEADQLGKKVLGKALDDLASEVRLRNGNSVLVFNDLSWKRSGPVDLDLTSKKGTGWYITDVLGKPVPSVVKSDGTRSSISFIASDVPSFGYKTFFLRKGVASPDTMVKAGTNFCENSFYRIEFGPGGITSLYDKELGREIINSSKYSGGDLLSMGYDGNGAGEFVQVRPVNFQDWQSLSSTAPGWRMESSNQAYSVFVSESFIRNFHAKQTIKVYHSLKRIDFEYDIPDWPGEHNRQLRVAFPLRMNRAAITYDVPMGIVTAGKDELRDPPLGWSWEGTYRQPSSEIRPREIENFISASDGDAGVTLSTNLAVCDWIDPGRESVEYPVLQGILLSSHKSCHYLGNWYHQAGSHHFRFSLTSHKPGWTNGYQFGVEANHPLYPVLKDKAQGGTLPEELSFISVSSPFTRITALKKSEAGNSLVMRMVEMEGVSRETELKLYFPIRALFRTSLIEEDPVATGQKDKTLRLQTGRNSVETYRLDF